MRLTKIIAAASILFFTILPALAGEMPPAPNGYSWVKCGEIKGAFLMPMGWYFKKGQKGVTQGYIFSKENIDESEEYFVGLSVNVVKNISQKTGIRPSSYANEFINQAIAKNEIFKSPWVTNREPFKSYGVVVLNRNDAKGDFITHNLAIANDTTGTLYLLVFESPAKTWESSWKIAEPMLKKFMLDDTI